jgi:hypothetical protein
MYCRGQIMTETNKALVRRWFKEVWNEGREATIDELFAETGVAYGLGDGEAEVRAVSPLLWAFSSASTRVQLTKKVSYRSTETNPLL